MKRILLVVVSLFMITSLLLKAEKNDSDTVLNKEIANAKGSYTKSVKDSILYEKLSAEQLMQLQIEESALEREKLDSLSRSDMPLNGFGIVMIVLMPFVFITLVLLILGRQRNIESQRRYDLYTKSLEMGQSIPEHFFDEPKKQNLTSNLKRGILWLSVGLALLIYFLVVKEMEALIVGIVPSFVGIGYLLVHLLEKPKNSNEQNG